MEILENITRVQVYGTILLIVGLIARYWVIRRRYNNNNPRGNNYMQPRSYEKDAANTFIENTIKISGYLLILAGVFLILIEWFNKNHP